MFDDDRVVAGRKPGGELVQAITTDAGDPAVRLCQALPRLPPTHPWDWVGAGGRGLEIPSPVDSTARWRMPTSTPTIPVRRCTADGPAGRVRCTSTAKETY